MGNKERTDEALLQLQDGIAALVSGDDWKAALAWQAKFHTYSFNNTLLIHLQRPDATFVRGLKAWNELGRSVRKGERGISILAPSLHTHVDEITGEKSQRLGGFHVTYVFDVAQTWDPENPDAVFVPPVQAMYPASLDGDVPDYLIPALVDQIDAAGYRVVLNDDLLPGSATGVTIPFQKSVTVKSGQSGLQAAKTYVHELAHIMLHVDAKEVDGEPFSYGTHRGMAETEAESVAYVVCAALGLPTDDYSFAYVGGWSKGDMALVKKTATRSAKTAATILDRIESAAKAPVSA